MVPRVEFISSQISELVDAFLKERLSGFIPLVVRLDAIVVCRKDLEAGIDFGLGGV